MLCGTRQSDYWKDVFLMKVKEYLQQVGTLDAQLKSIEANITRLRKDLKNLYDVELSSSWPDGQPHGTMITDPTGTKATKLADSYSKKREELIKQLQGYEYESIIARSMLWSKRMEIINSIDKLMATDDDKAKTYHRLLMMRYVDGASWEQIAVEIGYTWRHTIRLHGEALKRMDVIINE